MQEVAPKKEEKLVVPELEIDPLRDIKKVVDLDAEAEILCEAKQSNPNYLSIVYANQKFYDIFGTDAVKLLNKSYDFLFNDLDVDYASEDQLEYIRLIKDVKIFQPCSIIISLNDHRLESTKIRFKVNFNPINHPDKVSHLATFSFEKVELPQGEKIELRKENIALVRNLERTLHNERLLREVGALIISDLPIREISQKIANSLCDYLKADRCLLHDYREGGTTSFVVEATNSYSKKMLSDKNDEVAMKKLAEYINFQNRFYKKFGSRGKKSLLTVIDDVSSDYNFSDITDLCHEFGIISQIAITITFNGKVSGGIYVHQGDKRNWLADEVELIELVADQFSIAVDRSDAIEKVMVANHALMEKTAQLKDALKEEQKIRKMQNEFVALVSHEFKTPLQIIDSTRELLMRKIKSHNIVDEGIEKSLERIKSGIHRMNGLIHSTLNLAKMENSENAIKVEREIFDLRKFILDIIEKNSNLALNKNIKVVTKIDELPEKFFADPKLLDHSFTNIISNAIKYSKNDTVVKILAKTAIDKVAIRVIDQGIGIPKDDISNVGTKFFRAKNTLSVAGTGIGLYLTKHFVELHGGNVLIESEVNVGTSVTVVLPIVNQ